MVLAGILPFSGIGPDSTILWYSPIFYPSSVLARILPFSDTRLDTTLPGTHPDPFSILARILPSPVLARILPFSGTHTDSTLFRYSPGQFFDTRTDSTFTRYSSGFHHFPVLTLILPFFSVLVRTVIRLSYRFYLFPVPARIRPFSDTHTNSTIFRYLSRQFFDTRTNSTFSLYSPGFDHFRYSQ